LIVESSYKRKSPSERRWAVVAAQTVARHSFDHDDAGIADVSIGFGGRHGEYVDARAQRARVPWKTVPYVRVVLFPNRTVALACSKILL
jgi:hypothetical protein